MKYKAEIDGLRAVSIMAVVLNHAKFGISGGYIGVDIFFVISRYLITAILTKQDKISLKDFYLRRSRRILPMSILTCFITMLLGYFF